MEDGRLARPSGAKLRRDLGSASFGKAIASAMPKPQPTSTALAAEVNAPLTVSATVRKFRFWATSLRLTAHEGSSSIYSFDQLESG